MTRREACRGPSPGSVAGSRHSPPWGWGWLPASVPRAWGPPGPQAAAAGLRAGLTGGSGRCRPAPRLGLGRGLSRLRHGALGLGARTPRPLQQLRSGSSAPGETYSCSKDDLFQHKGPQATCSPPLPWPFRGDAWGSPSRLPCLPLWLPSSSFAEYEGRASGPQSPGAGLLAARPEKGRRRCGRPSLSVGRAAHSCAWPWGLPAQDLSPGAHSTRHRHPPLRSPTPPPRMQAKKGPGITQRTQRPRAGGEWASPGTWTPPHKHCASQTAESGAPGRGSGEKLRAEKRHQETPPCPALGSVGRVGGTQSGREKLDSRSWVSRSTAPPASFALSFLVAWWDGGPEGPRSSGGERSVTS